MKKVLIAAVLMFTAQTTVAEGLINDMQTCQGLIEFIDAKLDNAPASYSDDDVNTVRTGLNGYHRYIQREIVTPGLLQFNSGDRASADAMQNQVDAYKALLITQFEGRYPSHELKMDQAMSVNECTKKAVPAGQELEALKQALTTMVSLAQGN
jgi:hypothetical protein